MLAGIAIRVQQIPGRPHVPSDRERFRDLGRDHPVGEVLGVEKRGSKRIRDPPPRAQYSGSPLWVHVKERKARDVVIGQHLLSDTRLGYELVVSSFEDRRASVYRTSDIIIPL